MKEIYIVLSHTGTLLSRIVKSYTHTKYSHVSISIDKDNDIMYSFGRLKAYNPFFGGFVEESPRFGTYKRFKNATACIYSLQVTDDQYMEIEQSIQYFKKYGALYKFNMIGLVFVIFNKKINRDRSFYCAEFIKYLMEKSKVSQELPYIVKPADFIKLPNVKVISEGKLRDIVKNVDNKVTEKSKVQKYKTYSNVG